MTRVTPLRLTTRQLSQIGLTLERTFTGGLQTRGFGVAREDTGDGLETQPGKPHGVPSSRYRIRTPIRGAPPATLTDRRGGLPAGGHHPLDAHQTAASRNAS